MNFKVLGYIILSFVSILLNSMGLIFLVCLVTFADMMLGLYTIRKLKSEKFSFSRFIQGFLKMIFYSFLIYISSIISDLIFNGKLFDIKHLTPKLLTMLLIVLEVQSMDRKNIKLGNKPILETVRGIVKVVKEFKIILK